MDADLKARGTLVFEERFPDAQAVFALGHFNNWSTTATPLTAIGLGVWKLTVPSGVDVKDRCFFVLGKGEIFGRVCSHCEDDATSGQTTAA
ncbi:MAG: hypothetical protein NTW19_17590 [Planctomycetota bacterium]|nr:hypothetical protein [Planctomycetota bacterium]